MEYIHDIQWTLSYLPLKIFNDKLQSMSGSPHNINSISFHSNIDIKVYGINSWNPERNASI